MPRTNPISIQCEECNQVFEALNKRRKFCSKTCSGKSSSRLRNKMSDATKQKISKAIRKRYKEDPTYRKRLSEIMKEQRQSNPVFQIDSKTRSMNAAKGSKGKHNKRPRNIYALSGRTRIKIMDRLEASCCRCGWDEGHCDLHHMHGRKCDDPHNHSKIACVCPNCHRLIHQELISNNELISFEEQFGDKWLECYYG